MSLLLIALMIAVALEAAVIVYLAIKLRNHRDEQDNEC